MRILSTGLGVIFAYLLVTAPIAAQPFTAYDPDVLAEKATLLCNGRVESITEGVTDKTANPWDADTHFTAKIKVLHIFKGQAPPEIKLIYIYQLHTAFTAPIGLNLEKGRRYRLFLQKVPNNSSFEGILQGGYENDEAAEPLADKEPDDSPYLTKSEAVEIATKWLKNKHPEDLPELDPHTSDLTGTPCYLSNKWIMVVGKKRLVILGDRTIDEKAWAESH